ncbi:MAG: hypothetical protein NTY22_07650 [Proteobacteria bacterium]|nr:hypothetical protein [Pseudomonadota bacterium]
MGYIGSKLRLKKKGQAVVETLLLIALLVPLLTYSVETIRSKLGGALTGFLTNELRTQIRYGYSYQEMQTVVGGYNTSALPNIDGTMPITMQSGQQGAVLHPVQRVEPGWVQ